MPSVAFAGVLVTLGLQRFVLEFKIHLSEQSEFVFWTLLLTNLCKPSVTGSETATEGIWLLARHLCEYVLSQKQANGKIPADGQVVKSIVTTNLVDAVAKNYGAELIEVLTGFKWIGKQVLKNEQEGKGTYLFGMEESYGCLIGTYARDKDAISATAALCEAAAYYKEKGMTLWDAMVEMYEKYGYYKDEVKSIGLKGIEGLAKIQEIMEYFRAHTPSDFAGHKVLAVRDYKADTVKDLATGEVKPTGLPSSNVLYYELEDNAWLCVRPSGTEPKIKFYYGVKGTSLEDAAAKSEKVGESVMTIVNGLL